MPERASERAGARARVALGFVAADFGRDRDRMVDDQLARRGVQDQRVLAAMREVPREVFVPKELRHFAYEDGPLAIGEGQTISQPLTVAIMLEAAELGPENRVLDVGTGSGYAAAIASRLAAHVYTIERHGSLIERACACFEELGYTNITVRQGDGTLGWPEEAPFDAILAAAGGPEVPRPYCEQLRVGGRLVIPVGPKADQRLICVLKRGEDDYAEEDLGAVAFVPLVGEYGWPSRPRP